MTRGRGRREAWRAGICWEGGPVRSSCRDMGAGVAPRHSPKQLLPSQQCPSPQ